MTTKAPFSLLAVFSLLVATTANAQDVLSAEKVFDAVSTTYGKVTDYTADVVITNGKNAPWKGALSYKTPVYLLIQFSDPKGQVLAIDGEKLQIFIPSLQVVLVQDYKKRSNSEIAALASKQGLNILRANYGVAFLQSPEYVPLDEGSKDMVMKLKLTPKSSGAAFSQIVVSINKDNLITRMEATQSGGDVLTLDLSNIKINQNIPDSRFQYDPPPYANMQSDFLFDSSE